MAVSLVPGYFINRKHRKAQKYPATEARVLDVTEKIDENGKLSCYNATIEYSVGGKAYTSKKDWYYSAPPDNPTIFYNPDKPEKIYTQDDFKNPVGAYLLGGILGAVVVVTILIN